MIRREDSSSKADSVRGVRRREGEGVGYRSCEPQEEAKCRVTQLWDIGAKKWYPGIGK